MCFDLFDVSLFFQSSNRNKITSHSFFSLVHNYKIMSAKFRVTEIVTKTKKKANPVILRFQNGTLTESESKDVSFFRASDSRSPKKQLAVVTTKTAAYQGIVNDSPTNELVNNYLAIKNKKTGKVRVIQVDQLQLMHNLYEKAESQLLSNNQLTAELAHKMMIKNFGGKTAIRSLDRTQRMKMNVDIVKNQLEKTLEDSIINEEDEPDTAMTEANLNMIRPSFNADAKRVEDVFQISNIIPQELLDRMDAEARAVLAAQKIPISSEYLLGRIDQIKKSFVPDATANLELIKVFIYMDALEKLVKFRGKQLIKANLSNITDKVEIDLRTRFCEPNMASMTRTRFTKEKAICYYIALALITNPSYEMNLQTLTHELSMARSNLLKYAQLVFAKPQANGQMLSLRLPSKVKIGTFSNRPKKRN